MSCMRIQALLCIGALLSSCSSATTINVTDPEAEIHVDGEFRGRGTVVHSDVKPVGSWTRVTIRKEGCRDQDHEISRSETLHVGALIGGFFTLGAAWAWITKYRPSRTFVYECGEP